MRETDGGRSPTDPDESAHVPDGGAAGSLAVTDWRRRVFRRPSGPVHASTAGSSFLIPLAITSVRLRAPAPLR